MPENVHPTRGAREILSQEALQPQEERLAIEPRSKKLFIGIPREDRKDELRIALTPTAVRNLISHGHRVMIEHKAGERAHFSDLEYSEAGAEISHRREDVFKAKVLVKVSPPTIEEAAHLHANQILISPLQMPLINREYIEQLLERRVTAVAMEYMKDNDGSFPIVRIISEMAGISAIQVAAELMSSAKGGHGRLLGGVSGIPPSNVVILGAGVISEHATRAALGMGAQVSVFDNNVQRLMQLRTILGASLYTSTFHPSNLEREVLHADVVIGAVHSQTGRTPILVTEDMVRRMQKGSVIIDLSIDQGGCVETSEVTSHDRPTYERHGVTHYCVPNIAARVPRTASIALSNIITPLLLDAGDTLGIKSLLFHNLGMRHGVYTYKGLLTHAYLSRRFNIRHTNLDLLLTSNF